MKKVLIIEDDTDWQKNYAIELEGKVELIAAINLQEALTAFQENSPFDLIVLDACLESDDDIDTLPLLGKIRQSYHGPIITSSRSRRFRQNHINGGCSHEAKSKGGVPRLVLQLLGIE